MRWLPGRRIGQRPLLIAATVGLLLATSLAVWAWLRPPEPGLGNSRPLLQRSPMMLSPGLFMLGDMFPAPVYVVDTSDGLVLVDSGLDNQGTNLARGLSRLGLDLGRMRVILLTHVHGDHSLGAQQLKQKTGAKIYAGQDDSQVLRDGGPREAFFTIFPFEGVKTHPTDVDVKLAGGETIQIGEARFQVIAAPGHTPGSICYLLERDNLRVLFTGDVVVSLSDSGSYQGLGTHTAYLSPRYRGNAWDYLSTLQKLREMPAPDLVLPGHAVGDGVPRSPWVTPEEWRSRLDKGIRAMQDLVAHYEADGVHFLDGVPKELLPGLHYLGDFGGAAIYCLATPAGQFLFDAPGGPGLVGFLESRLQQAGLGSLAPTAVLLTSCDDDSTAGLQALVHKTGCKVVCPKEGLENLKASCTATLLSEDDFGKAGWFPVQAIALQGRGVAPMAYLIKWQGKRVLVSGRIPTKINKGPVEQLLKALSGPGGSAWQYRQSLHKLRTLKPDLWLPFAPVDGQNANLYADDWDEIITTNEKIVDQ